MFIPFENPIDTIDPFHERELDRMKRMCHREIAVAAALNHCTRYKSPAPAWLVREAGRQLCDLHANTSAALRGRSALPTARLRQDIIHYARWDIVVEIREKQIELPEVIAELRAMKKPPRAVLAEKEKFCDWVGKGSDRAFECASMLLHGTDAAGGPDAMKRSYNEVRNQPYRFKNMPSSRFLKTIGITVNLEPPAAMKSIPLYDLTLEDR